MPHSYTPSTLTASLPASASPISISEASHEIHLMVEAVIERDAQIDAHNGDDYQDSDEKNDTECPIRPLLRGKWPRRDYQHDQL